MKIIKSQDLHYTIPICRIIRTTVEEKGPGHWIITATVDHDRAVTLARYSSEQEALAADTCMWLCEEPVYCFPVIREESS